MLDQNSLSSNKNERCLYDVHMWTHFPEFQLYDTRTDLLRTIPIEAANYRANVNSVWCLIKTFPTILAELDGHIHNPKYPAAQKKKYIYFFFQEVHSFRYADSEFQKQQLK